MVFACCSSPATSTDLEPQKPAPFSQKCKVNAMVIPFIVLFAGMTVLFGVCAFAPLKGLPMDFVHTIRQLGRGIFVASFIAGVFVVGMGTLSIIILNREEEKAPSPLS